MGGGVAGWLTPGWMTYESSMAPHIATPSKIHPLSLVLSILNVILYRLCEDHAQGGREPQATTD